MCAGCCNDGFLCKRAQGRGGRTNGHHSIWNLRRCLFHLLCTNNDALLFTLALFINEATVLSPTNICLDIFLVYDIIGLGLDAIPGTVVCSSGGSSFVGRNYDYFAAGGAASGQKPYKMYEVSVAVYVILSC